MFGACRRLALCLIGGKWRGMHISTNGVEKTTSPPPNLAYLTQLNTGLKLNTMFQINCNYIITQRIIQEPVKKFKIEGPLINNNSIIENNYKYKRAISDPSTQIEKQAARLIVIRRRKMKRHKLKKLRVKMKFEWAKVRQRREMRKEKDFQIELLSKIKEAEKFDAAAYASEKITKANEVLIPKLWKGKRLPEFVIRGLIEKEKEKKEEKLAAIERRKIIKPYVSDYDV